MFGILKKAKNRKIRNDLENEYLRLYGLYERALKAKEDFGEQKEIDSQIGILKFELTKLSKTYEKYSLKRLNGFCGTLPVFSHEDEDFYGLEEFFNKNKTDFFSKYKLNQEKIWILNDGKPEHRYYLYTEIKKMYNKSLFKSDNINDYITKKTKLKVLKMLEEDFGDKSGVVYEFIKSDDIFDDNKLLIVFIIKERVKDEFVFGPKKIVGLYELWEVLDLKSNDLNDLKDYLTRMEFTCTNFFLHNVEINFKGGNISD